MKFSLFIHMERSDPSTSDRQAHENMLELCRMADDGGMHAIWTGEHHGMNFTISPNPLLNLVELAHQTKHVRLGTGTIIAPFWHPVKLAGELAMTDILTEGRLEVGIARGAYSFEYERLMPGMDAMEAGLRMREIIPAIKGIWQGDYSHIGDFWQFPATTSTPQPRQRPHPPLWVAARDPNSHEFAVTNGCNVQVTPLSQGDEEVSSLMDRFNSACMQHPDILRPNIMLLRHAYVASDKEDVQRGAEELGRFYNNFGAWFANQRKVNAGFMDPMTEEEMATNHQYSPEMMCQNLVVGEADQVVERLQKYADMGYDEFSLWIDSGMSHSRKRASLERFIERVMPAFEE